jgi:hypothetical protein
VKEETVWDVLRSDWRSILFASAVAAVAIGLFLALWLAV